MTDDNTPPGLTVKHLRSIIADLPDDMVITVRFAEDDDCAAKNGGIVGAYVEPTCHGDDHLCIYASDQEEDFEDE